MEMRMTHTTASEKEPATNAKRPTEGRAEPGAHGWRRRTEFAGRHATEFDASEGCGKFTYPGETRDQGEADRRGATQTNEERITIQRDLMTECADITRRACEDMIHMIDAGKFEGFDTEVQFSWLYTLKNRREMIKSTLRYLDGCREDRTGQSTRAAADQAWKG